MKNYDKLAVLKCIAKRVKEEIENLEREVKPLLMAMNNEMGVKQISAKIGDKKIATISIKESKRVAVVTDADALHTWATERGLAQATSSIDYEKLGRMVAKELPEYTQAADVHYEEVSYNDVFNGLRDADGIATFDGEIVEGVEYVGGEATGILVGQLKVDDAIAELVRGSIPINILQLGVGDE